MGVKPNSGRGGARIEQLWWLTYLIEAIAVAAVDASQVVADGAAAVASLAHALVPPPLT